VYTNGIVYIEAHCTPAGAAAADGRVRHVQNGTATDASVRYYYIGASARAARNATETRLERIRVDTPVFVAAARGRGSLRSKKNRIQ